MLQLESQQYQMVQDYHRSNDAMERSQDMLCLQQNNNLADH